MFQRGDDRAVFTVVGVVKDVLLVIVRSRVKGVNVSYSAENWRTYPELMSGQTRSPRFNMVLIAAFGLLVMLLAAIGTYGLLAYQVAQRTRALGVRLARGARRGTLVLARVLTGFVSGVSPRDPLILSASAGFVLFVALVASLVPAVRASRVHPSEALAAE